MLTDIEGTTTPISFVRDVLFPYARARIACYVAEHADDAPVAEQLAAVGALEGGTLTPAQAGAVLGRWIDEDRKATPLKALQGMIWAQGYADGTLVGPVYADVPEYLERWKRDGRRLYVYSSGSIAAQRLIFGHSGAGDLTPLFSGYFDTTTGPKRETASYRRIAERIALPAAEILFLSDLGAELDAASMAGMHTCQLVRDEQAVPAEAHRQARDFSQVMVD
ncbi:MAG TPA: acireductone synthase [Nevskiaceae bacterium]